MANHSVLSASLFIMKSHILGCGQRGWTPGMEGVFEHTEYEIADQQCYCLMAGKVANNY
jgi:hypothetical protein